MLARSAFKPRKSNAGRPAHKSAPAFLQWLRGRPCVVTDGACAGRMEAAHVRIGTDGGTGTKPSDCHAIPLCSFHHAEQHRVGELTFQVMHDLDMKSAAAAFWWAWPGRSKWEAGQ